MPIPELDSTPQRVARDERTAEEIAELLILVGDERAAERNKRAGIVGQQVDSANLGPLFFYGGPFVDSGSGANPIEDTTNGQGGGTGVVANTGRIKGVTIYCQVPPSLNALSIPLLINGDLIGTASADVGIFAYSLLPLSDTVPDGLPLTLTGLTRGQFFHADWNDTDGTVAGVHVYIALECDVQRGVG